jgi:hypothetical protein
VNSIVLRENILEVIVLIRLLSSPAKYHCCVRVKSILGVGPKVNNSIEDPFK